MSKIKLTIPLMIVALLTVCNVSWGQQFFSIDPMFYQIFDKDSLQGFDEEAARKSAISEGFLGSEFKIKMYRLKREYIDNKYNLVHAPVYNNTTNYLTASRPAALPGCVNEDFEASTPGVVTTSNQVLGWTITGGYNGNISASNTTSLGTYYPGGLQNPTSCNLIGCCPMPPLHSEIIDCSSPTGYTSTAIGGQYPIFSVFGSGPANAAAAATNTQITGGMFGTKVLRLNNELTGDYGMQKLSKTFSVSAQNALFQFAFISVFAPGHGCCDAGGFQIRLTNATANTVIPCPSFSVSAPSSACTATVPIDYLNVLTGTTYSPNVNFGNIYHPWKVNSMDLTAYIGQNITIDIIISDCNAGGHYGCIYFDAQCGPMTVYGNGNPFAADITQVVVPTCGAAGATICAADGLGPYSWGGVNVPVGYTIPSMTNQCLVTNISETFTLYMQPQGSCFPISRVVTSTITPAPLITGSALQATCGSTLAVLSVTPAGSAANPSTLTWFPTPYALSSSTTQGTYVIPTTPGSTLVVTVSATDPLGCLVTTTLNVNAAPPIPTFSIVNVTNSSNITCYNDTIQLDAVTNYSYNAGSLSYFWASNSNTYSAASVNIVNPGTYTVIGTDLATQCNTVQTISIGVNTVAPSSAITPTLQNITCSVVSIQAINATASSPTVNVSHIFVSPQGGTFVATSYSTSYLPGGVGVYTHVTVNDINGCTTQKTFTVTSADNYPTYNVTSPVNNFTLGCNSRSVATILIENAASTQTTPGAAVSYTIIGPPTSTAVVPGNLSINTSYTINVPGTWTVITKDNNNNCETRTPISILQNTFAPGANAIIPRQILDCNVSQTTLKATANHNYVDYQWNFPAGSGTQLGDTITVFASTNLTSSLVANYTLTTTDKSSTCKSVSVIPIYQNLYRPVARISNGGLPAISCKTQSITLSNSSDQSKIPDATGFPKNLPVIGFLWQGPTPQEDKSESSTYVAGTVGEYTMTAKDLNNGCTSTTVITIADDRIYPLINTTPLPPFVLDCGANSTKIRPTITTSTANLTYSWTTPASATVSATDKIEISVNAPGVYDLEVYDTKNGCRNGGSMTVINGSLTAGISTKDSIRSGYAPLSVTFINNTRSSLGTSSITSLWSFGNGTTKSVTSVEDVTTVFNQPGTYTVTLFAGKGTCVQSDKIVIKVEVPSKLIVPNVFTPNDDGVNDFFFLQKGDNLTEIKVSVIDRWGHKVYELTTDGKNFGWDGNNQSGQKCPEGTYFYKIKATGKDGVEYDTKGTVNLIR